MEKNTIVSSAVWGIFIGIGIIIAGISISKALYDARAAQRYVTVKGLAEQEVDADLAIWPITFKDASNDLGMLQKNIDRKRELITNFLTESGFQRTDISNSAPKIQDTQADVYYGQRSTSPFRYIAQTTTTLRSENVQLVKQSMEKSADLVGKGIVLIAEGWENRTEFLYTSLNEIKPAMIEEATINARKAAEKFAEDSGSKVGKIRNATQGLFSINDRDINTRDRKKVRVVTTVQYFLIDD
jgi:hypothetical protein